MNKQNTCLLHYADLPETDKHFERLSVMGTLKAVLALGYRIEGP
jgi:hypothetical protein